MSLLQAIHERWAANAALCQLLPAARVYTGLGVDHAPPYATVLKVSDRPTARVNDGRFSTISVRISIVDEQYERAAAVVEQAKATFDRVSFPLSGNDRVIDMQCADTAEEQRDNGLWRMTLDLACMLYVSQSS